VCPFASLPANRQPGILKYIVGQLVGVVRAVLKDDADM
jgi:hypothetical protein